MNKYIISIFSIISLLIFSNAHAVESVTVSAVVGNINHSPVVISVTPNNNPKLLSADSLQNFVIRFRDDEQNHVYYTITTESNGWYTSPISWEITTSSYDSNNETTIDFSYLAWSVTWVKTITVTINDGPNVISKDINVYIY